MKQNCKVSKTYDTHNKPHREDLFRFIKENFKQIPKFHLKVVVNLTHENNKRNKR